MRMHIKSVYSIILVITAVVLIIISFAYIKKTQKEEVPQTGILPQPEEREIKYVPGDLIVKIKPEVKKNFAKVIKCRNPKDALYRDSKLYGLGSYDIREVKHLFPDCTFKKLHLTQKQRELVKKREEKMPWQKEHMPKIREKLSRVFVIKCPSETDIEFLCKEIEKLPYIEYCEPNYICYTTEFPETLPNDTYVDPDGDNEWHFAESWSRFEEMWGLRAINMKPEDNTTTAWSLSQGEGIVVAVIDTGLDYTHEDLEENIWINIGEVSEGTDTDSDGVISFDECISILSDYNGDDIVNLKDAIHTGSPLINDIDDDANGFVDDIIGWDFGDNDNDPFDGNFHGSHVAGTIAAVGNNEKGIIGVAPKARLMAAKGLGSYGTRSLAQCIEYAANNGAKVLNNSWSSGGASDLIKDIISDAHYIKGSVVVAAAGNTGDEIFATPAIINEVITVANMEPLGRALSSSWGNVVDVIAPGNGILSVNSSSRRARGIDSEGKYLRISGTSMASPHVSGLAALILSRDSTFTNEQVNQIIRVSAVDVVDPLGDGVDYTGFDIYTGYGLIDVYNALLKDTALECRITQHNVFESLEIEIKGIVNGANFRSYSLEYQIEGEDVWNTIVTDDTTPHPYTLDADGNPIFDTLGSFTRVYGATYTIKLSAKDIYDNTYIDRYVILNRPPVLALEPLDDTDIEVGETVTYTVSAIDADDDLLIYTINYSTSVLGPMTEGPPPGAIFIDRIFTWKPTSEWNHRYVRVQFTVSDGYLTDWKIVFIRVGDQYPYIEDIGEVYIAEGESLSFTVIAHDRDPLTYSVTDLPTGAVFSDQIFTWIPTYDQAGTYRVRFTVSDGELTSLMIVTITVININRPPVLEPIGDKSVNEGETLTFTISATDPEGDPLTYTTWYYDRIIREFVSLPPGAVLSGQTFSWTPTYEQAGRYFITFIVIGRSTIDDEDVSATEERITITVNNVNRPPELTSIGDRSVDEGEPLSFTVLATDPDGDPLTYTVSELPPGAEFSAQTFTWTPTYDQAGTYSITFTVSDGELVDTETITITVNDVNRPPELEPIGDRSVNEGETLTFTVSGTDPDDDTLTYSVSDLPPGAEFSDQVFTWTPTYDQAGAYSVTFTVSDGELTDSETITITVNNVNRPPELEPIGDRSVDENETLTFTVSATDPDGDTLTYSVSELPPGAVFSEREFTWTPTYEQAGTYTVTFAVSDGELTDSETITITVNNINRPPVLSPIGNRTTVEGFRIFFKVSATDPDRDSLSYSASGLPSGAIFNSSSRLFVWTPRRGQAGSYYITFTVTDNGTPVLEDSETVRIAVIRRRRIIPPPTPGSF